MDYILWDGLNAENARNAQARYNANLGELMKRKYGEGPLTPEAEAEKKQWANRLKEHYSESTKKAWWENSRALISWTEGNKELEAELKAFNGKAIEKKKLYEQYKAWWAKDFDNHNAELPPAELAAKRAEAMKPDGRMDIEFKKRLASIEENVERKARLEAPATGSATPEEFKHTALVVEALKKETTYFAAKTVEADIKSKSMSAEEKAKAAFEELWKTKHGIEGEYPDLKKEPDGKTRSSLRNDMDAAWREESREAQIRDGSMHDPAKREVTFTKLVKGGDIGGSGVKGYKADIAALKGSKDEAVATQTEFDKTVAKLYEETFHGNQRKLLEANWNIDKYNNPDPNDKDSPKELTRQAEDVKNKAAFIESYKAAVRTEYQKTIKPGDPSFDEAGFDAKKKATDTVLARINTPEGEMAVAAKANKAATAELIAKQEKDDKATATVNASTERQSTNEKNLGALATKIAQSNPASPKIGVKKIDISIHAATDRDGKSVVYLGPMFEGVGTQRSYDIASAIAHQTNGALKINFEADKIKPEDIILVDLKDGKKAYTIRPEKLDQLQAKGLLNAEAMAPSSEVAQADPKKGLEEAQKQAMSEKGALTSNGVKTDGAYITPGTKMIAAPTAVIAVTGASPSLPA